ncbi:DUF5719 family protein [Cnuibacter physcomitrellae]|uniref:DUF5719 family protein n=1 Tax=Cnuibacter physcomitrellae TaxID=1619308 RepID=UPI002175D8E8|nr:DUF5719 family protein [Cnuibacter physcomitrellae]MCS5496275.1 DUF5719 family protein [Cnuibacter physcomitrellae]
MPADRRMVARGARIAAGVVGVVAVAASVGVAFFVPLPSVTAEPRSTVVDPTPAAEVRACPGGLVRLSDDSGQDATAISSIGAPTVTDYVNVSPDPLTTEQLASPDDRAGRADAAPVRVALPAGAQDGDTLFGAGQAQVAGTPEISGLAVASCTQPTSDTWLVAGATTTGRTSFVILANPQDVAAKADIAIFDEKGQVEAPGARGIDIPARSTRILSLAGLAPDATSPVLHVTTTVGAVTAAVQQSVVRGLEPGGVELAGPSAPPSTEATVPGIEITSSAAISGRLADADEGDLQSILRLYLPGTEPAAVRIHIQGETEGSASTDYQVGLTPGVVTDFPLQDVPDGTYTVTLESDHPVVTAARTSRVDGSSPDLAWFPSVQAQAESFVAAVPAAAASRIHLYNPGDSELSVTVTGSAAPASVTIPAHSTRFIYLDSGQGYRVESNGPVAASLSFVGDGRLAGMGLMPPDAASPPVLVYG